MKKASRISSPSQKQDAALPADRNADRSGTSDPAEIAAYIGHMAGELATLARGAKLGALAYLLDMAEAEAAAEPRNRTEGGS